MDSWTYCLSREQVWPGDSSWSRSVNELHFGQSARLPECSGSCRIRLNPGSRRRTDRIDGIGRRRMGLMSLPKTAPRDARKLTLFERQGETRCVRAGFTEEQMVR